MSIQNSIESPSTDISESTQEILNILKPVEEAEGLLTIHKAIHIPETDLDIIVLSPQEGLSLINYEDLSKQEWFPNTFYFSSKYKDFVTQNIQQSIPSEYSERIYGQVFTDDDGRISPFVLGYEKNNCRTRILTYPTQTSAEYVLKRIDEEEKMEDLVSPNSDVFRIDLYTLKELIDSEMLKSSIELENTYGEAPVL
jgi:hypothetical protein